MSNTHHSSILTKVVNELSTDESLKGLFYQHRDGHSLPSNKALNEVIELSRAILLPGYYGKSSVNSSTIKFHIGVCIEKLYKLLYEQILAGLYFEYSNKEDFEVSVNKLKDQATKITLKIIENYPKIRQTLSTDIVAAYNGDPAVDNYGEIIACYPAIKAIINHRIAHALFIERVPLIPRMISEMAHSETGIDIHPGASIDEYFTIDHGTGVVIGSTCVIGKHVKLYQGVTLGAKSFPLDEEGNPIKGIPRHPILKNNVIVYSNATILGRITIGEGSIVGANIWVTEDMEPNTKKYNIVH